MFVVSLISGVVDVVAGFGGVDLVSVDSIGLPVGVLVVVVIVIDDVVGRDGGRLLLHVY